MKKFNILMIGALLIAAISCKKPAAVTTVPTLSFLSYTHFYDINNKDTTGLLKMYFVDGDGDMGLNQDEPGADFYSTLWFKKNNVWKADTFYYNYRIPYLVGQGGTGTMKGEIDITFNKIIVTSIPFDSVKFQCYIVDRAGNQSNKIFTDEIDLKK